MGCETKEDIRELARLKEELSKDQNNVYLLLKIGMLLSGTDKILFQPIII